MQRRCLYGGETQWTNALEATRFTNFLYMSLVRMSKFPMIQEILYASAVQYSLLHPLMSLKDYLAEEVYSERTTAMGSCSPNHRLIVSYKMNAHASPFSVSSGSLCSWSIEQRWWERLSEWFRSIRDLWLNSRFFYVIQCDPLDPVDWWECRMEKMKRDGRVVETELLMPFDWSLSSGHQLFLMTSPEDNRLIWDEFGFSLNCLGPRALCSKLAGMNLQIFGVYH